MHFPLFISSCFELGYRYMSSYSATSIPSPVESNGQADMISARPRNETETERCTHSVILRTVLHTHRGEGSRDAGTAGSLDCES